MIPDELPISTIAGLERILDDQREVRECLRRKSLTDEESQLLRIVEQLAEQVSQLTQVQNPRRTANTAGMNNELMDNPLDSALHGRADALADLVSIPPAIRAGVGGR